MTANLLFLAGSSRKDSFNKKLARLGSQLAEEEGARVTYIDLNDYAMPLYDGDMEDANGLPENAIKLKKLFIEHDGFFVASPEYNSGYSALLKNSLDWISRKHEDGEETLIAFKGKTAAISSAAPGALGGLRGLVQLRMVLGNIGVTVIPTQAAISKCADAFDDQDHLVNESQSKMFQKVITEFVTTATALKK